jgi:hypothetical protein
MEDQGLSLQLVNLVSRNWRRHYERSKRTQFSRGSVLFKTCFRLAGGRPIDNNDIFLVGRARSAAVVVAAGTLVLMGAYGHSRTRQTIFDGFTRPGELAKGRRGGSPWRGRSVDDDLPNSERAAQSACARSQGERRKRLAMADIRGRFSYMKRALSEAFGGSRAPHEQDLSGVPLKNQTSAQLRRLRVNCGDRHLSGERQLYPSKLTSNALIISDYVADVTKAHA